MCWQEGLPGPPEDPEGGAVPREDMSKACALLLGEGGSGGMGEWGVRVENCASWPSRHWALRWWEMHPVSLATSASCPACTSRSELASASALPCAESAFPKTLVHPVRTAALKNGSIKQMCLICCLKCSWSFRF